MREICNLIIDRTIKYLDSSTIFQIEPEEAMDKVSLCYQTLKIFKSTFRQYKDTIPSYFESGDEKKMWTFQVMITIKNEIREPLKKSGKNPHQGLIPPYGQKCGKF